MVKDLILALLENKDYTPLTYQEIAQKLIEANEKLDLNEIYKTLVELENNYEIIRTKKDCVISIKKTDLVVGTLEIKKKGFGFVRCENFDVFVAKKDLNGAINKDKVFVKIESSKDGINKEGSIYSVIQHGYDLIVGNLEIKDGVSYLNPDDSTLNFLIEIKDKNLNGATEGHKVLGVITETDAKNNKIYGKIKNIIGHINDVGIDILATVYKYGFNPKFSNEVIKEANQISKQEIEKNQRTDLRNLLTITIDGADAKDLDDAISLEINDNNEVVLYVSIADVSYYVKENSALDKEAYYRGTSVYLVDRVVPMLPPQLSNGLCSLLPKQDRLTQTCKMIFDDKGEVIEYEIFESIINSNYRLTYTEVNEMLAGNQDVLNEYSELITMIQGMAKLALLIRKIKHDRGMLDFMIAEPKIIVDKKGEVVDIQLRSRGEAERIIEDFMIIANETVAQHIYWLDLPFVYRVHDKPNSDKLKDFMNFAQTFNIKINQKTDNITSKAVQKILEKINQRESTDFLDRILLRTMAKAIYQRECIGHFGLASKYYTHFTSPIRRYPDLIVHRLLRKYLYQKEEFSKKDLLKLEEKIDKISERSSKKERDAIEAEREVNERKMAEYMAEHLDERHVGIISSITSFGFFVELANTVEGLVHISTLRDDHYHYDAKFHILIGERTNKRYRLGQYVNVVVDKVDIKEGNIDFKIVKSIKKDKK